MGCAALTGLQASDSLIAEKVPFKERYEQREKLGQGSFGTVFLASDLVTGHEVAVKVLDPKAATDTECTAEIRIWKSLCSNRNIVKLLQVCQDDEKRWHIVMERCKGTMWDRLLAYPVWTVRDIREEFSQILEGVEWIHDRGYLHRDIKAENVLYGGPDGRTMKIGDFGLSTRYSNAKAVLYRVYGSSAYMSPEMISKQGYGKGTDVWSTGVLFYVVLFGHFPFGKATMHRNEMKAAIVQGKVPTGFVDAEDQEPLSPMKSAVRDLVKRLLARPEKKRVKIEQALEMPIFEQELTSQELTEFIVKREATPKKKDKPKEEGKNPAEAQEAEKKDAGKPAEANQEIKGAAEKKVAQKAPVQRFPSGEAVLGRDKKNAANAAFSPRNTGGGGIIATSALYRHSSGKSLGSRISRDSIANLAAHGFLESGSAVSVASGPPVKIPGMVESSEPAQGKEGAGPKRGRSATRPEDGSFNDILPGQKVKQDAARDAKHRSQMPEELN